MKEKIIKIAEKVTASKYVPNTSSVFRAGVSAIPVVGGALDHLIFDKSDEIRTRNIEIAITSLENKYQKLEDASINLDWFLTGEAVNLFKELISLIEYEDSQEKLDAVSQLYALSSLQQFSHDQQKVWVMRKVSELSNEQRKLFVEVAFIPPEERKYSSGALQSNESAIWNDAVLNLLNNKVKIDPLYCFWSKGFNVDVQLELLCSAGVLERRHSYFANNQGYKVSVFGLLILEYLKMVS